MRRKTSAHNAIIVGILLGMLVGLTVNAALGILVCLGVSIGGFIGIRAFEKAVYKGADAISDQISDQIAKSRNAKKGYRQKADGETENLAERFKTTGINFSADKNNASVTPQRTASTASGQVSSSERHNARPVPRFCPACGTKITPGAKFCYKCGSRIPY